MEDTVCTIWLRSIRSEETLYTLCTSLSRYGAVLSCNYDYRVGNTGHLSSIRIRVKRPEKMDTIAKVLANSLVRIDVVPPVHPRHVQPWYRCTDTCADCNHRLYRDKRPGMDSRADYVRMAVSRQTIEDKIQLGRENPVDSLSQNSEDIHPNHPQSRNNIPKHLYSRAKINFRTKTKPLKVTINKNQLRKASEIFAVSHCPYNLQFRIIQGAGRAQLSFPAGISSNKH